MSRKFLKILCVVLPIVIFFSIGIFFLGTGKISLPNFFESTETYKSDLKTEPLELEILRKSYPDVVFVSEFDEKKDDWKITVTAPIFPNKDDFKVCEFYWADGRMLYEDELANKEKYWKMIYPYSKLKDPALLSEEEIERIRKFGSAENRRNGAGSSMFFFDFLYAAKSRIIIEDHIVPVTFLGKKTKIHERIKIPLERVEKKIYSCAQDKEIKDFIEGLHSADCYNWREIAGTSRKSFHTYGIAIDLMPKRLGGKEIFWAWAKERYPEKWMLVPFEKRWTPPKKVIDFFEEEGFIWGGNWIIFDNMHFEFHPELINATASARDL